MKWVYVIIGVLSGTVGDVFSAKGMFAHGEVQDFGRRGIGSLLHYIVTNPWVVVGIVCDAIAFFAFVASLGVAEMSFAVPATAISYILKTMLAQWYLGEYVSWRRWAGVLFVGVGVVLIAF